MQNILKFLNRKQSCFNVPIFLGIRVDMLSSSARSLLSHILKIHFSWLLIVGFEKFFFLHTHNNVVFQNLQKLQYANQPKFRNMRNLQYAKILRYTVTFNMICISSVPNFFLLEKPTV